MTKGGTEPASPAEGQPEQRGILCNDPNGLCLAWKGGIDSTDAAAAGVYTNLTRLASKLAQNNDDASPLITLETESAAWLVKEYDGGHAVALKCPVVSSDPPSATTGAESSTAQNGSSAS